LWVGGNISRHFEFKLEASSPRLANYSKIDGIFDELLGSPGLPTWPTLRNNQGHVSECAANML